MYDDYDLEEEVDEHATAFFDGIQSQTDYSFLVFEWVDLFYVNEYGERLETKFE